MHFSKTKLYALLCILSILGFVWLGFAYFTEKSEHLQHREFCMFKSIYHIPCPSCGVTRAILYLIKADLSTAFMLNPLSIPVCIIMFSLPVWLVMDTILGKDSLYKFYIKIEGRLRKPMTAFPLIGMILLNWIWNIYKQV